MILDITLNEREVNIINNGGFLKMVLGSGISVTVTKDTYSKENKENDTE